MAEDPKPNPFEHLKRGRHVYYRDDNSALPVAAIVSHVYNHPDPTGVVNLLAIHPNGSTEAFRNIPYDDRENAPFGTWHWMFAGQERVSTAGATPSLLEPRHAEQVALNDKVAAELSAMQSEIGAGSGPEIPAGGMFAALAKKPFDRGKSIVVPLHFDQSNADDPWKNRSAGMRCRTCMWFVAKAVFEEDVRRQVAAGDPPAVSNVGRCRRHAPTMGGYPVVFDNDWCGDHRLDERKA